MGEKGSVRIDKFLWAVRLFKTRAIASEAIKKGKVTMQGSPVKTSRVVKVGDCIDLRVPPIVRSFKVLALAENRMGAKLVPGFVEEVTTEEMRQMWEISRLAQQMNRKKGLGRPTKKERRDLDEWFWGDEDEEGTIPLGIPIT